MGIAEDPRLCGLGSAGSHLSGRDELQRPQRDLEIGGVGLEVVQGASDVGLQLGRVLPRRAVGGDLVDTHGCGVDLTMRDEIRECSLSEKKSRVGFLGGSR